MGRKRTAWPVVMPYYRAMGQRWVLFGPSQAVRRDQVKTSFYGFTDADRDRIRLRAIHFSAKTMSLRDSSTLCERPTTFGGAGTSYMTVQAKRWWQNWRFEQTQLYEEKKLHILGHLTAAEGYEHTLVVGQNASHLGGESFIASMDRGLIST
jgi:2-oxoglutarate dehydrogenase complex dehydrogenase (E1) component-like enzyme